MTWSEQVGVSIILPSDHVDGDGRNYMVVGADIPPEIASNLTAGIVFYSGSYSALNPHYPNGFIYWVFGITTSGTLEIVAYYYSYPTPESVTPNYYRQSLLSVTAYSGINNNVSLMLGGGSFQEGSVVVAQPNDTNGWQSLAPAAGWTVGNDGMHYLIRLNVLYFQIHAQYVGTWPANSIVCTFPVKPAYNHWPKGDWGANVFETKINASNGTLTITTSAAYGGVVVSGCFPI